MTFGALYLAALSALVAQAGQSPDADADEGVIVAMLSGAMLTAGAVLLLLAWWSA